MARRRSGRPKARPRQFSPRLIVACEGLKTEYLYLARLNQLSKRPGAACLALVQTKSSDPVAVVERVIHEVQQDRGKGQFDERQGDAAFALLDVEPHDPSKAVRRDQAIRLAEQHNVRVLLSNPCFEFWLLCHFATYGDLCRAFDAAELDQRLSDQYQCGKRHIHKHPNVVTTLINQAATATEMARTVHQQHHHNQADIRSLNACTEVYVLVERLMRPSAEDQAGA